MLRKFLLSTAAVNLSVTLTGGSTFDSLFSPNLQVCANTVAFTAKVTPSSCASLFPAGQYFSKTESGTTATETFTLSSAFSGQPACLQIHLNTNDPQSTTGTTENTSMAN